MGLHPGKVTKGRESVSRMLKPAIPADALNPTTTTGRVRASNKWGRVAATTGPVATGLDLTSPAAPGKVLPRAVPPTRGEPIMSLRLVEPDAPKRQEELPANERARLLKPPQRRDECGLTEDERVLLEELVIAIRRVDEVGGAGLPTTTLSALELIEQTVRRTVGSRG